MLELVTLLVAKIYLEQPVFIFIYTKLDHCLSVPLKTNNRVMHLLNLDIVTSCRLNVLRGRLLGHTWMPAEFSGPPAAKKQKKTITQRIGKWVNSMFGQEKYSKTSSPQVPFEAFESRFTILRQIGEGEFAKVMLAQCPKTDQLVLLIGSKLCLFVYSWP